MGSGVTLPLWPPYSIEGFGVEPKYQAIASLNLQFLPSNRSRVSNSALRSRFRPSLAVASARAISSRELNTSLPWCVHPGSIKLVFYESSQHGLFSGTVSGLDAFSPYLSARSYSALPCQTADRPVAPLACSSRTKANLPSDH